jgi:hypothetical protein
MLSPPKGSKLVRRMRGVSMAGRESIDLEGNAWHCAPLET